VAYKTYPQKSEASPARPTREDALRLPALLENVLRPLSSIFNSPRNRSIASSRLLSAAMQVEEPPLAYDASATAADIAAVEAIAKVMAKMMAETVRNTPEFARLVETARDSPSFARLVKGLRNAGKGQTRRE
jgi:hypothetical protein